MARRDIQSFNLSFLDLLSGALGAVIFLFIIVPKGKSAFPLLQKNADASVLLDTQTMRIIGRPVTGARFKVGDTITVIINGSYKDPVDSLIASVDNKFWNNYYPSQVTAPRVTVPDPVQPAPTTATTPAITPPPPPQPPSDDRSYKGPKPSAPCKLAFELSWGDEKDNVDILVQKGGRKVSGVKQQRTDPEIGRWDTGVSKTKVFKKTDFRTNVESVRQIEGILPGEYRIYAIFKASEKGSSSVNVNLLLYSKNQTGAEKGETYNYTLSLRQKPGSLNDYTFLGTASVKADGSITFSKS